MNQPNFESPRLLMCGEKPYLVFCYGNETSLNVGVFALDPRGNDDVDYAVELASQSGAFTKGKQRILPFNDRLHCTACFRATCTKIHHKYSKLYKDNTVDELHATLPTKFEIEPLKKLLETEKVKLTVTLKSEIDAGGPAKKRKLELPPVSDCETCKVLVILPETCKKLGITLAEGIRRHVKQCPCNADINEILADEFDAGDIMEDVWALPDVGLRDVAVQTDVGEKQKESEDNCVPGLQIPPLVLKDELIRVRSRLLTRPVSFSVR
ncbi:hypothetical protein NQ318_001899 [Aromia moschata]|uniref:Uncharacterized protein n=1 Tax=Aromia moschata TaxID=1265417 RepID=A0AAV8Z3H5_9CUCU|nr:hypothetical protein NQ318_001899 [Aromia moschata]